MTDLVPLRRPLLPLACVGLLIISGCGGDGGGMTGTQNEPPQASISSPSDGATFVEGSQISFQGSASDPNESSFPSSGLTWSSDLDGELGTGAAVTRSDLSVGDHTVTLTATDPEGASDEASVSITVEPNDPPSASIASPSDGAVFGQGAPIEFRGSGDDPQEGQLGDDALQWSSDLDGALGAGATVTRTDLSVGDHAVTLTATDPQGATGEAAVSLTVEQNGQPTVSISSPADGATFQEGSQVDFQGSASDPEDGALTGGSLTWSSDVDGEIGTGESVSTSGLSSGEHTITLRATDSRNAFADAQVSISVEGDPTASISAPADSSIVQEGDAVTFQGSATDPLEGSLTGGSLVWSSDVDGELGTGESLNVSTLSGGPHVITLTATDADGNTDAASLDLLVEGSGYDVRVRFIDTFSSSEMATVQASLDPWEAAITGDLPGKYLPPPEEVPAGSAFAEELKACLEDAGGVDDLLVCVFIVDQDGEGGVLASAAPFDFRDGTNIPAAGVVFVDDADRGNAQLETIMTHEVGHVLGIGSADGWTGNLGGGGTNDPFYLGTSTNAAFDGLGGTAYLSDGVPVANQGGGGTAGAHWREVNLFNELMTGFINAGSANPLSTVTLGALEDIGYAVDPGAAEGYSLPMPQEALWEAEADATLSRPASSSENFGLPGSTLGETLVAGANDGRWSSDPAGEVLSFLVRFGEVAPPSGVSITDAQMEMLVASVNDSDPGSGHAVEVVRVTEAWSEGTVTWDARPGMAGSALFSYPFNTCTGLCTTLGSGEAAFVDLVRGWAGGSVANHGLHFRAPDAASDSTFSVGYRARHAADASIRPLLRVFAETGAGALRALRADSTRLIPLGEDVLDLPRIVTTPEGRILKVEQ